MLTTTTTATTDTTDIIAIDTTKVFGQRFVRSKNFELVRQFTIESQITLEKLRLLQQESFTETLRLSILYMKQGHEIESKFFWRSMLVSFFLSGFVTFTLEKLTSIRYILLNLMTVINQLLITSCKNPTLNLIPLFSTICENLLPPLITQLNHIDLISKSFDLGLFLLFFSVLFISMFFALRLIEKDFSFMGFSVKSCFKI